MAKNGQKFTDFFWREIQIILNVARFARTVVK